MKSDQVTSLEILDPAVIEIISIPRPFQLHMPGKLTALIAPIPVSDPLICPHNLSLGSIAWLALANKEITNVKQVEA